jgi:hypothetical protein
MAKQSTAGELMELVRAFQPACIVIAAAELDVFTILHGQPTDAARLAGRLTSDLARHSRPAGRPGGDAAAAQTGWGV